MAKPQSSLRTVGLEPFAGQLTLLAAASAIQAARLNALDLLETAQLLNERQRYAHSTALAVLALEEAGKVQILMLMVAGVGDLSEHWRAYRRHTSKTASMNFALELRASAHFPNLSAEELRRVRENGPGPEDLDALKQLALYSDCFKADDAAAVHLPRNIDWRQWSEERLAEATALVKYLRDYPPEELELWAKHGALAKAKGASFVTFLKPLHDELLAKGFITEAQWAPIFRRLQTGSDA